MVSAISCTKLAGASKATAWPAPSIRWVLAVGMAAANDRARRTSGGAAGAVAAHHRGLTSPAPSGMDRCRSSCGSPPRWPEGCLWRPAATPRERRPRRWSRHGSCRQRAVTPRRRRPAGPQHQRADLGQRHHLGTGRTVPREPPGELVGDDHLDQLGTMYRQVDGDRRSGAGPDHDRGRGPQGLQQRGRVAGMGGDRAYRVAAGAGIAAAVVGQHARRSAGQLLGRRPPQVEAVAPAGCLSARIGSALAHLLVIQVASRLDPHRTHHGPCVLPPILDPC